MAEQEQLNIYQKLAKIRKQVEVIQKNKRGYGYTYVSEEEILAKITVFMDKYHLSLIPGIVGGTTKVDPYPYKKTKTTKGGEIYEENVNEVLVSADMTWTWVNNDNPEEKVVVGWTLVGQQSDASQAFGSGLTYSDRYFLLKYFNVATTDDDPDAHRSKQRAAEAAEDKMIAEQIIGTFDEVVKAFLKANESKAEDVKKFVSKYAKGGNYFAITESTLAAKLLDDFKETFKMERYEKRPDKLAVWEQEGISRASLDKFQVRYDGFSDRLVYPIRSPEGKIVNIGGRTLDEHWKEKNLRKYTYFMSWGELKTIYGFAENLENIKRQGEIILFEGCKSVLMADTWGINNAGAILTSHLNPNQMKLLIELGCRVVFALDKEVSIRSDHNIARLKQFVNVEYIWDGAGLLDEKDSPVDKGPEVWKKLYEGRLSWR